MKTGERTHTKLFFQKLPGKFVLATLALGWIIGGIANPQRPGAMENVNRQGC